MLNKYIHQFLKLCHFIQCRFETMLMSCHRNLILVYINWPMAELVLLYTVLLKVTEPINNMK